MLKKRISFLYVLVLAIVLVVAIIGFDKEMRKTSNYVPVEAELKGIMGVDCYVVGITNTTKATEMKNRLKNIEWILRKVEAKMSISNEDSEFSRLNRAVTNQKIAMSESTAEILNLSKQIYTQSDGAFDITINPLVVLWEKARGEGKRPTEDEIAIARAISYMDSISISGDSAWKDSDTTLVDPGRIAKGYATDKAIEELRKSGFNGGFVQLGGDFKCFGFCPSPIHGKWQVAVWDSLSTLPNKVLMVLLVDDQAVCTNANYESFYFIEGKTYSHIIDPRTGYPMDPVPMVTVIADSAAVADAWTEALSVLGVDGFSKLPKAEGIEAMILTGSREKFKITMTAGFESYIKDKLPDEWDVEVIK